MKSVIIENITIDLDVPLLVSGDPFHHLIKVMRSKLEEEVLILNGEGLVAEAIIKEIHKKEVVLQIRKITQKERYHDLKLAICKPKKEALDSIIKMATELGVSEIIPILSDFSQKTALKDERVTRLIDSAMIQSNNPFRPIFAEEMSFVDLVSTQGRNLVCFVEKKSKEVFNKDAGPYIVLIGPEGGFSSEELEILEKSKIKRIHLKTPILRSPTAMATALGFCMGAKMI